MRDILQAIKRWHFWVLCPTLLVLATVVWFLGVGGLKKKVDENRNTINGLYTAVSGVRAIDNHPNQDVAAGMDALIGQRRSEVSKAWTEKYRQQTADDGTLSWPEELGQKFIDQVKDLRPIEKMVTFPVEKDLILDDRRRYQEHLANELPKLAKMVGAKWFLDKTADPSMTGERQSFGGDMRRPPREFAMQQSRQGGETLADQSLVEWSPQSQMEILAQHFPWGFQGVTSGMPQLAPFREGFQPSGPIEEYPNLLEILYAQEDLWVLQAIMNVIAKTNEGATARFNAVVKEIDYIRMGKAAGESSGHITRLAATDPSTDPSMSPEGGMETAGPPSSMHGGQETVPMDGDMPMEVPVGDDPAEGRYVDEHYKPLSASQLRQVMSDFQAVDPSLAYLAVAKRVPVRFRVKLDQAGLDRLLTECANSPLTIEVRQVRINPTDTGAMDIFTMPRGGEGDMKRRGGPPSRIQLEGPGLGVGQNTLSGADAIDAQSTTDVTAEIYGIVYIYNPVDEQVLGIVSSEDATTEG